MIFELQAQFINQDAHATAHHGPTGIMVRCGPKCRWASSLSQAIRIACQEIGPLMEGGDRVGEGWGLMVAAGQVSVAYGNWPSGSPCEPGPEHEVLRRILAEYRPGDGARAALHNATNVIEAYAHYGSREIGRAA